jgi:hypothetical protein
MGIGYKMLPALRRPRGKSGQSASPVLTDWSEPSAYEMLHEFLDDVFRKKAAEDGEIIDETIYHDHLKKRVDRVHVFRSTFTS